MPVFSRQHIYVAIMLRISIPPYYRPCSTCSPVRTVVLSWWLCYDCMKWGKLWENETVAELVDICPNDLFSLLPALPYQGKTQFLPLPESQRRDRRTLKRKEPYFYPQNSLYNVRKGFDETTGPTYRSYFPSLSLFYLPFSELYNFPLL